MHGRGKLVRSVAIFAGFYCLTSALEAVGGSGVIRDKQWSIKIQSNKHGTPAASSAPKIQRRNVIPATYQQPEAPPTPEGVQPAPVPEAPKVNGPQLTPVPATNSSPTPSPLELVPSASPPTMSYEQAYAAIPFSRTEYEANPTYRHQAALELMFHTLRPTTLVQNYTPRASRYPDSYQIPYGRSDTQHINIRHFGGGTSFNGQSPFGYPYGLRGNW